jgi:hypothetical protein
VRLGRHALLAPFFALITLLFDASAEASLPRTSAPVIEAPALTLASPAPEPFGFSLFEGTELAHAAAESSGAPSFHPLAAVSLLDKLLQTDLAPRSDVSYPKTRVWAIDVLGSTLVSRSTELSLESHWACGDFSCGLASGGRKDPLGLQEAPRNPTADQWSELQEALPELRGDRPDAVPSRGEASIGAAFRKHGLEVGVVVGGFARTAATEAVIYYAQGKVAELGIRLVLRGATHFFRTLQEATAFARSQGATVRYIEEGASRAPTLAAKGTRFEAAAATLRYPAWKPGDPFTKMTAEGAYPTWETIRSRYWINRAATGGAEFAEANRAIMGRGFAPKARVIVRVRETGALEERLVEKELHHARGNRGVAGFDSPLDLREVWPWEHEELLPAGRRLDYDFVGFSPK